MNLTEKIWPTMTCPNGHPASMAGCHTQDCQYTILAPLSDVERAALHDKVVRDAIAAAKAGSPDELTRRKRD